MTKNKDIYMIRYLNGRRNFKRESTVFNEYETEELLGEKQTQLIAVEYFEQAKLEYVEGADITRISIDTDNITEELRQLNRELLQHSIRVGGNDDEYDYFPDLVYAFEQICEAFDMLDYYHKVVEDLNLLLGYKEEDELFIT